MTLHDTPTPTTAQKQHSPLLSSSLSSHAPSNPPNPLPLPPSVTNTFHTTGGPRAPDLRHGAGRGNLGEQSERYPGGDGARPLQRRAQRAVEQRAGALFRPARDRAGAGEEAGRRVGRAAVRREERLRREGRRHRRVRGALWRVVNKGN